MNGKPHIIGQREAQAKALVAQQLSQLTAATFTRAAAESLTQPDEPWPDVEHFRVLAQHSHTAAKSYYEGLGLAEFTNPEDTP